MTINEGRDRLIVCLFIEQLTVFAVAGIILSAHC